MNITRTGIVLKPDASRVLFRPFNPVGDERPLRILARVLALPEAEVVEMLAQVMAEFKTRHQRLLDYFLSAFRVRPPLAADRPAAFRGAQASDRRLLHPRIFARGRRALQSLHRSASGPDRTARRERCVSFSACARRARAISPPSPFAPAPIDGQGKIQVDTPSRYVTTPDHIPPTSYDKDIFWRQLQELGVADNDRRNDSQKPARQLHRR